MPEKHDELEQEIAGLREDIDVWQAAVAAQDVTQEETIATLQALVDQPKPATNEQLEELIESIKAARADVQGTLPTEDPPEG